jgi:hypothetical protein
MTFHLLVVVHVVWALCACIGQIMKRKSLKSLTRTKTKSNFTLLQYFANSRNVGNVKPLWLVCDSMPLPFDGDGLSKSSHSRLGGLRFPMLLNVTFPSPIAADVISPLPFPIALKPGGPFHAFISLV